ncbi:MarR family winged helix-turn-helix transcriptional regulator [Sporanaerobacter acetigenes]|uniref:Transcriptional regulator, MarR family n=1 Tax=Sporanaerobacter acetigenes DSM 13106 TaxID=1123281 RepID=A0A1M5Y4T9_9FIRM|nr:MarR family transcriptional regulator [Sporanaerobacter acetigenes]SHI06996.1 transcriptional regulator, MarR family [Sporanaerobacter acetigenes DSM 13106]
MINNSIYEDIRYDLIKFMSLFHRLFSPTFKKETNDKYSCNKNQVKTIMIIGRAEKVTPTILGKCMDMEKGSLTSLIDSMEKMGLVYRVNDEKDRRKTWIYLTDEGEKYYINQEKKFMARIKEVFGTLSEKDVKEFNDSLKTIVTILDKMRGE